MTATDQDTTALRIAEVGYEPHEMMVRYLQAALVETSNATWAEAHLIAMAAVKFYGSLVIGLEVSNAQVRSWLEEARRRNAWLAELKR